jgi:DNA-binding CsgD family transcriptional regulator
VLTETQLLRLALAAYEAAADPDLCSNFLRLFGEAVSTDSALAQINDIGQLSSFLLADFGLSAKITQACKEYHSRLNGWREYHGRPAPREDEQDVTRFLIGHLNRAWDVLRRLELWRAGESVLDTLPLGVVFLSRDAAVIYSSRTAEEIFQARDGLCVRKGRLSAEDRRADAAIRKVVSDALSQPGRRTTTTVSVPRSPHARKRVTGTAVYSARDYQVAVAPPLKPSPQFAGKPRRGVVVVITDPERPPVARVEQLIQIYKLTPKEAAFAAKLCEGKTVEQVGEELDITYETARTHLRRIFSKTGTSRQAELLLLVARLPPAMEGEGYEA